MPTRSKTGLGLLILLTIGALLSSAEAQEKFTIRDSWTVTGLQAGWHWAIDKGYFKQAGLDVHHEDGNGSTTTVQLVNSGQFDVGYADLSVMAIARSKGMPLVSIAGVIQKTSIGVFVSKGSNLKTPKDLEGKQILYTATSFEGPFIDSFLKAGGTTRDKVNMVSVDASAKISNYVEGRGDGMITSIPLGIPFVEKARPSDYIRFGDFGLSLPSYGLVVREDTLAKRREGLTKLTNVLLRSWQEIIDKGEAGVKEAADIMMKRRADAKPVREQLEISVREHIKYLKTENTASKPLGYQSLEDWKNTVKLLEDAKLIPTGSKPESYFNNSLIAGAGSQ